MASRPLALTLLLTALLTPSIAQLTDPATIGASIKYDKNWSLLAGCVNQCLWDNGNNDVTGIGGDIALQLSCGSPYVNGCYCRPQSATFIHSFITSCASYLCVTPADADIASGTSVYAEYCSQALGAAYNPGGEQATVAGAITSGAAPAPSSGPTIGSVRETAGLITTGPVPTSTSGSGQNADTNTKKDDEKIAGLSKGAFIGVVVSCTCSVLGLLFGAGFKIYKHKKNNKLEQERLQQLQYNYQPKV